MLTSTFALTAAMAIGALAQNITSATSSAMITRSATSSSGGSAQTTITALVGEMGEGLEASIIGANACETTLALSCAADNYICSAVEGVEFTVTQGPNVWEMVYETSTAGGVAAISQSCDLDGPSGAFTQAVCSYSLMLSAFGESTATASSTTLFGSQSGLQYAPVGITAGAEKLPSGPATCTETSSGSAAAPTGIRKEIYKIIVPVGAALAAGAMM